MSIHVTQITFHLATHTINWCTWIFSGLIFDISIIVRDFRKIKILFLYYYGMPFEVYDPTEISSCDFASFIFLPSFVKDG